MVSKLKPTTIAIYARFSSDRQREASIDDQIRRCRDHILRTGGDPALIEVFTDYAISGSSLQRPQFEAMMAAVDAGRIASIVTEDISRISRDFADAALIFRKLQFAEVPLISVADGIDTSSKHAKLSFTVKSLVADLYLDDLRDKTLRGLEGRALAGYATGKVAHGFKTTPEVGSYGTVIGHKISIDEKAAEIIRRIFREFVNCVSFERIARDLNVEGIPSPRHGSRHKRFGWGPSTIRAILYNEAYVGIWKFKSKQWVKVPGTNRRLPRKRAEADVMRFVRPELRIIDEATWEAAQERLAALHRKYTGGDSRTTKDRGVLSGRRVPYLFSGIAVCDECGAPLGISSGSSATYYKCSAAKSRGTCQNNLSIKEAELRTEVLRAITAKLKHPESIKYVRQRVAEELRNGSQKLEAEIKTAEAKLAATEEKIQGLIQFIAGGDRSEYVTSNLRKLEAEAKVERATVDRLKALAQEPLRLPSLDEITAQAFDLKKVMEKDVQLARVQLKRWLKDGEIRIARDPDAPKGWTARGALSTLDIVGQKNARHIDEIAGSLTYVRSGGRI